MNLYRCLNEEFTQREITKKGRKRKKPEYSTSWWNISGLSWAGISTLKTLLTVLLLYTTCYDLKMCGNKKPRNAKENDLDE